MRILVTGRGFDSHTVREPGIFEWDQARALRSMGHDVRFAAVDTRSLRARRPWGVRTYTHQGIFVWYGALPAGRALGPVSDLLERRTAAMLWESVDRSGWTPEVIHSHFGCSLFPGAIRRGIPRVYTEHFSRTNLADPPPEELERERRTYALSDRLLCVSGPLRASIRRNTGREALVIPNVVDVDVFSGPREQSRKGDGFRFVSVGSLIRRKGFDLLLDAMGELKRRGLTPELSILGSGEEEDALRKQAERLGVAGQVTFAGFQPRERIAEEFLRADAFVLPSRGETFGVVYVEAMAAALPVIATVCGGPEDFVNDQNGLVIPPEDVPALTDAMEDMMKNRSRYDGAAIARFARDGFRPESVAARLTAVYEELLSSGKGGKET